MLIVGFVNFKSSYLVFRTHEKFFLIKFRKQIKLMNTKFDTQILTIYINFISAGKVTEKHPSALVKFNEVSITEAIEENSTTSYCSRGRRASIKDRLPTPLPSPQESIESVGEAEDNEEDSSPGIQQDTNKDLEGVTVKDRKENISTVDLSLIHI